MGGWIGNQAKQTRWGNKDKVSEKNPSERVSLDLATVSGNPKRRTEEILEN
jgi:hypothetical protein